MGPDVGILGGKAKAAGRIPVTARCALSTTRDPWLTGSRLLRYLPALSWEAGSRACVADAETAHSPLLPHFLLSEAPEGSPGSSLWTRCRQSRQCAHSDNVTKGVLQITPGPGHPVSNTYHPLLGHLLRGSGSSGATGEEQRGLGKEGEIVLGPPPFLTLHL